MSQTNQPYPSTRHAWYMVVLLTIAYVLSFVDRYVLGLLVEPIKADMALTDTQIGLLLGPAFAIFYATMGLPLGWMADRKRRSWIVAFGIAIWSAATAASGLARNFIHLFIARVSVGVGEATLSPCAMSMIADSFPKKKRGRPIAFYSAALSLGAGIASLTSASVLSWAKSVPTIELPLIGTLAPWQFTFIILGLPGLFVSILFFMLKEPTRRHQLTAEGNDGSGFADMLKYVGSRWTVFASFVSLICLMTIVAYSQGWLAAMFKRSWGWEAEKYALINGLSLIVLGPLTVNFAGWLSDRMYRRGHHDAPLLIVICGAFILVPTGIIGPLMPSAVMAFIVLLINTIGIALVSATALTALLNITPGQIRGQTVALYYMVISMAGLFLGPSLVGVLTDYVFGAENLRYSVAAVPLIFGLPVLALTPVTRRLYQREFQQFELSKNEST